jgi:hypothetical protein
VHPNRVEPTELVRLIADDRPSKAFLASCPPGRSTADEDPQGAVLVAVGRSELGQHGGAEF